MVFATKVGSEFQCLREHVSIIIVIIMMIIIMIIIMIKGSSPRAPRSCAKQLMGGS